MCIVDHKLSTIKLNPWVLIKKLYRYVKNNRSVHGARRTKLLKNYLNYKTLPKCEIWIQKNDPTFKKI